MSLIEFPHFDTMLTPVMMGIAGNLEVGMSIKISDLKPYKSLTLAKLPDTRRARSSSAIQFLTI